MMILLALFFVCGNAVNLVSQGYCEEFFELAPQTGLEQCAGAVLSSIVCKDKTFASVGKGSRTGRCLCHTTTNPCVFTGFDLGSNGFDTYRIRAESSVDMSVVRSQRQVSVPRTQFLNLELGFEVDCREYVNAEARPQGYCQSGVMICDTVFGMCIAAADTTVDGSQVKHQKTVYERDSPSRTALGIWDFEYAKSVAGIDYFYISSHRRESDGNEHWLYSEINGNQLKQEYRAGSKTSTDDHYHFTPIRNDDGSWRFCSHVDWDAPNSPTKCITADSGGAGSMMSYAPPQFEDNMNWRCYRPLHPPNFAGVEWVELRDYVEGEIVITPGTCNTLSTTTLEVDALDSPVSVHASKSFCKEEGGEESWEFGSTETTMLSQTTSVSVTQMYGVEAAGVKSETTLGVEDSTTRETSTEKSIVEGKSTSTSKSSCIEVPCEAPAGTKMKCQAKYEECQVRVQWTAMKVYHYNDGRDPQEQGIETGWVARTDVDAGTIDVVAQLVLGSSNGANLVEIWQGAGAAALGEAPDSESTGLNEERYWSAGETAGVIALAGFITLIVFVACFRECGKVVAIHHVQKQKGEPAVITRFHGGSDVPNLA